MTTAREQQLWQRAERIRIAVDTVRATREAIAQQRTAHRPPRSAASA
ncbi:hypothetical protein ACIBQ5_35750 [Streptomyces massasporeus]